MDFIFPELKIHISSFLNVNDKMMFRLTETKNLTIIYKEKLCLRKAIECGSSNILEEFSELRTQNILVVFRNKIFHWIAFYNKKNILPWLLSKNCNFEWNSYTISSAAAGGHLKVLKKIHSDGYEMNSWVISKAAQYGHLEIIKWARENELKWTVFAYVAAAVGPYYEILQWLYDNGCPWDARLCEELTYAGNLSILKWVRERQCPWNDQTCIEAKKRGHLEILSWACKNGCPHNHEQLCSELKPMKHDIKQMDAA